MSRHEVSLGDLVLNDQVILVLSAARIVTGASSLSEVLAKVLEGMAEDTYRDAGVRSTDSGATAMDKVMRLFFDER